MDLQSRKKRPVSAGFVIGLGVLAIIVPLIPAEIRFWNFALFGALGILASARLGLFAGVIVCLGAKLLADMVSYFVLHPGDPDYLPIGSIIVSFAIYPLMGLLLQKTRHAGAIGGTAILGSLGFFLITNSIAWMEQVLPYGYTWAGYVSCLNNGLPFYRGTFLSDLIGTMGVFALHGAVVTRFAPTELIETIPVGETL
jgi:hypothetical protein